MGWPTTIFMRRLIPAVFAALGTLPSRSRNKVVRRSLAFQPSLRRESQTRTREMTDNRSAAIVNGRPHIRVDIYRAGNGPFASQTPQLNAQQIGSYVARLSEIDHFNSSGQRLTSAAAIIRQDRANVHRYGKRDLDDESDTFFAEEGNRAVLEQMLDRGRADPGVLSRIVNGTPRIRVAIYRGVDGPFVRVTFLD